MKLKDTLEYISKNFFSVVVLPIMLSAGTFLITKDKFDQEVKKNELENIDYAIKIYKQAVIDLQQQVEQHRMDIAFLETTLQVLKDECEELKK